jgi:hypothetical protein
MIAGRAPYRVHSKWITVASTNGILYFALDSRGNLVKARGRELRPDHIRPVGRAYPARNHPPHHELLDAPAAPISRPAHAEDQQPQLLAPFDDDYFSFFQDDFDFDPDEL